MIYKICIVSSSSIYVILILSILREYCLKLKDTSKKVFWNSSLEKGFVYVLTIYIIYRSIVMDRILPYVVPYLRTLCILLLCYIRYKLKIPFTVLLICSFIIIKKI